jgi:hypothetical protein
MKKVYWVLIMSVVLSGYALASGRTPTSQQPAGVPLDEQSFRPTKVVKCRVVEVQSDRVLLLRDIATGENHAIRLDDDVTIKARSKKDFDGRKNLTFADLAAGQEISVTVEADTGRLLKVRVMAFGEVPTPVG